MGASDYNLCISADHKDVVIARNHGMGFHDNNVVTGQFEWVCEQLGYFKKGTCDGCVVRERPRDFYGHGPTPCFFCARNDNRDDLFEPKVVS